MTAAERQKRYRDKKRREREEQPAVKRERRRKADRDRKRAERAVAVATLSAAPVMPPGPGRAWCEALTVTQGEGEGEPLRLLEWERAFLRAGEAGSAAGGRTDRDQGIGHGSASKRPPTVEYGLSVPAGPGKTTIAAAVAGPCGFEFRRADGRGSGSFGPGGRSPAMQRCPW